MSTNEAHFYALYLSNDDFADKLGFQVSNIVRNTILGLYPITTWFHKMLKIPFETFDELCRFVENSICNKIKQTLP